MPSPLTLAALLLSAAAAAGTVEAPAARAPIAAAAAPDAGLIGALRAAALPDQPGGVELRQALAPETYRALQAVDRLDPASAADREALQPLLRALPKGFEDRLRAYHADPEAAEARALAALLTEAHDKASASVGERQAERVRKALEAVAAGKSSLTRLGGIIDDLDRLDLYGPGLWGLSNQLREAAAGYRATGPSETAEETALRLLGRVELPAPPPPSQASAPAPAEAAPPPPRKPLDELGLAGVLREILPARFQVRETADDIEFYDGRKLVAYVGRKNSDETMSVVFGKDWSGFHVDFARRGIVLGPAEERGDSMIRYEADRFVYSPDEAAAKVRDLVLGPGRVKWDHDLTQMKIKAGAAMMPEQAKEAVMAELDKMQQMKPGDSEFSVARKWVESMLNYPWSRRTVDHLDVNDAQRLLDENQYGLQRVKQRILEFLAVKQRKGGFKGVVLVLDGPPGVGKTALAKGIAKALGREFVRVAMGGVHGEDEIRGHTRTFVGAEAGRIAKGMMAAKTRNPVMLLDEVDKLGRGSTRGDPDSALLEVLDPEQNYAFRDHFLDTELDLSEVFFIATSNDLRNISKPLLDRMELIQLPSYTQIEKLEIADRHLLRRSLEEHGLDREQASLSRSGLAWLIEGYTREGGVRRLKQVIDEMLRKIVKALASGAKAPGEVGERGIGDYLGPAPFGYRTAAENGLGLVTGLAVGNGGGSVIQVEVATGKGTGKLNLRNQFKEMAEDSAHNALAFLRDNLETYGLKPEALDQIDIDVTFTPAIDVDGPSAGTLMVTGLLSKLTGRPARRGVAMTGELTVTGRVLPIGGIEQKILAAKRGGAYAVMFPMANLGEVKAIAPEVIGGLKLIPVSTADEVFAQALMPAAGAKR